MPSSDVHAQAWEQALPQMLSRLHVAEGRPPARASQYQAPYGLTRDTGGHVWLSIPEAEPGSGYAVCIDPVNADAVDASVAAYRVRGGRQHDLVWSSAHGAQHPAQPGSDQDLAGWLSYIAWQTTSGRQEELSEFDPAAALPGAGQRGTPGADADTDADIEPEA